MLLVPGETEPVTRRRYRDMFKGVQNANAHFRALFEGLGLKTTLQSHIQHKWRGQIGEQFVNISLSNMGRWEVGQALIEISVPLTVDSLLAVGDSVPPLRRIGMTSFGPIRPHLSSYSHDEGWSRTLLASAPGALLVDALEDNNFLYIEPKKLIWNGDIFAKDDRWMEDHLRTLLELATTAQSLPAAKAVPDSTTRRFAPAIAIGLGVLFLGFVLLCFAGIAVLANL
jgi:hypothetical protein